MNQMLLDICVLDQLPCYFFDVLHLPAQPLADDEVYQGKLPESPKTASVFDQAEWFLCKFDKDNHQVDQVLNTLYWYKLFSTGFKSAQTAGERISKLIQHHRNKQHEHAFLELLALLAEAVCLVIE
ncbi:hypothetical protein FRC06_010492, partial [Ceratobasidium sp. 370]